MLYEMLLCLYEVTIWCMNQVIVQLEISTLTLREMEILDEFDW